MKWLFIFLLVINVGIFAWNHAQKNTGPLTDLTQNAGFGNIRLISELSKSNRVESPIANEPKQESSHLPAPNSQPAPPFMPPVSSIDHNKPFETPDNLPFATTTPKQEIVKTAAGRCNILGRIETLKEAQEIKNGLSGLGIKADIKEQSVDTLIGHWVIVPKQADADQAVKKVRELKAAGFTDLWHFQHGDLKNAISLGMFSKEENARHFSQLAKQKGFNNELRRRYINNKWHNIEFPLNNNPTERGKLKEYISNNYPHLILTNQNCNTNSSS